MRVKIFWNVKFLGIKKALLSFLVLTDSLTELRKA